MSQKQHKPGCKGIMSCLVYHPDGVCPGPYGVCTCDQPNEYKSSREKEISDEIESMIKEEPSDNLVQKQLVRMYNLALKHVLQIINK